MKAKRRPQQVVLSLLLGLSAAACDGIMDLQPQGLTRAQVAGTYALQSYNGEPLPHVLRSTYSGEFNNDGGPWLIAPITIDPEGLLTLRSFFTVTFLGPKDPPGIYTAYPPGQQLVPGGPPVSGSVVLNADSTCAVTLGNMKTMGTYHLTHHVLEWTGANLALKKTGRWTATRTHGGEPSSAGTYTDAGTFSIDGSQIVFLPSLPPSNPDCTVTATLAGEVLTAVVQCQGTTRPQETSVWIR